MAFQYYTSFYSPRQSRHCPGVKAKELTLDTFQRLTTSNSVKELIENYRNGTDTTAKQKLPAVTWCGYTTSGMRKASDMVHTGFFLVDVDHCENPREAWAKIWEELGKDVENLLIAHVTPSGKGLRMVHQCVEGFVTLEENMQWLNEKLNLSQYGDFDTAVKDVSRLSFIVDEQSVLYFNKDLFLNPPAMQVAEMKETDGVKTKKEATKAEATEPKEDVSQEAAAYRYRGHLVSDIVRKYVEVYGEPGNGERHNFYNQMVKYFRCITDNNPLILCELLPRFDTDATEDDYLSQCRSICRTNTTGRLPKEFFMFLLKNGFYRQAEEQAATEEQIEESLKTQTVDVVDSMPALPPVFREIVKSCPRDFVVPCINALLPVMGTMTSYVRAVYPFDARHHSTEFFSIVYAPPGTGKGFIERFIGMLHRVLELRDLLSDRREAIYCAMQTRKGDNERSPENPRVTKRIMEAKNSETDFLEKQAANNGHHMFTYAAEMDQWRKGVRAAGGNKDDMIRIAWDNGYYGQSFKSPNSFKGRVRLYWNVLITGTKDQLDAYFKNVTNGLVTRCGFAEIRNQEFADAPVWKKIGKRDMEVINAFVERCDAGEYRRKLDFDFSTLNDIPDEDFDKEVPWRYEFNEVKTLDIDWIMPTIKKWLKAEQQKALLSQDMARDVFRRRVAVRGFRLALLCTQLYDRMSDKDRKTVEQFVAWWMSVDIEQIIALYGQKYNDVIASEQPDILPQPQLWQLLDDTFTIGDLVAAKNKVGTKTEEKVIIYRWKRCGLIEKGTEKGTFIKINSKTNPQKKEKK